VISDVGFEISDLPAVSPAFKSEISNPKSEILYPSKILPRIPDPPSFRVLPPRMESLLISFPMGMLCSQTLPVPFRVARKIPSPPKIMERRFLLKVMASLCFFHKLVYVSLILLQYYIFPNY